MDIKVGADNISKLPTKNYLKNGKIFEYQRDYWDLFLTKMN